MSHASGHGDKEGTGGEAFVSVEAGGEEGFGARDEARRALASGSGPGTRRAPMPKERRVTPRNGQYIRSKSNVTSETNDSRWLGNDDTDLLQF